MEMAIEPAGSEYRSPARAKPDGVFLAQGEPLSLSSRAEDYMPGDLVTWDLGGGVPHIGVVVDQKSSQAGRYMIVHNIGQGPRMEDVLFHWKITGHYRYFGPAL